MKTFAQRSFANSPEKNSGMHTTRHWRLPILMAVLFLLLTILTANGAFAQAAAPAAEQHLSVNLSIAPDTPQPAYTPITLTATTTGGEQAQYQFRVGYQDAAGWHWTKLDYSADNTCLWIPTIARTYSVVVWARAIGSTANYDVFKAVSYQVTP